MNDETEDVMTFNSMDELFRHMAAMRDQAMQIERDRIEIHRGHTDSGAIAFIADIKRERAWDFNLYPPEHAVSTCECDKGIPGHTTLFMEQTGISPGQNWVLQIASQVTHNSSTRITVSKIKSWVDGALAAHEYAIFFPQNAEDFAMIRKFLRRLLNNQDPE